MACSKCGGDTEYRQGVSQKNGKPWAGNKCLACNNMDFVKVTPHPGGESASGGQLRPKNGYSADKDRLIVRQNALSHATEVVKLWMGQLPEQADLLGEDTIAQIVCRVGDQFADWVYQKPAVDKVGNEVPF